MRRPELGAVAGLIVVLIFFLFTASPTMFTLSGVMTILAPASQLGILAIAAALLMIGGEFDLSIGSMIAFAGLVFAAARSTCIGLFRSPYSRRSCSRPWSERSTGKS